MARLVGNTRRQVNVAFWASFVIVLAILGAAGTILFGLVTRLAGG